MDADEIETCLVCSQALDQLGIRDVDLLATFLFGGRARGTAKSCSDYDLIFFLREDSKLPEALYRRLACGDQNVDANLLKPSHLPVLCRRSTGWSYRVNRLQLVKAFTKLPAALLSNWHGRISQLLASAPACRARKIRHLRDARSLIHSIEKLPDSASFLQGYLAVELFFSLPLVQLNRVGEVPFERGDPWSEAMELPARIEDSRMGAYLELGAEITRIAMPLRARGDRKPGPYLKKLHDANRAVLYLHRENMFDDGFGARIATELEAYPSLLTQLPHDTCIAKAKLESLLPKVRSWLGEVVRKNNAEGLKKTRGSPVKRHRSHLLDPRHIEYDIASDRLKLILPTGGCRVPTCKFCMLPDLARVKTDIDTALTSARNTCPDRRARQVSVYTDGSFFDKRELSRDEQASVAEFASSLQAEEFLVESLPRFIDEELLQNVLDNLGPQCRLRLAVGVQSTQFPVRKFITGTPIAQSELLKLFSWRNKAPFSLRIFLLANKPMLTHEEDRVDLLRSLELLGSYLTDEDVVTVNPLLPTRGTLVSKLADAGYWRPIEVHYWSSLKKKLLSSAYPFSLEFGPLDTNTCTLDESKQVSELTGAIEVGTEYFTHPHFLPWPALGGLRHRAAWADSVALNKPT